MTKTKHLKIIYLNTDISEKFTKQKYSNKKGKINMRNNNSYFIIK